MDNIPKDQWCTCDPKTQVGDKEYPPQNAGASMFAGLVGGLFGRGNREL